MAASDPVKKYKHNAKPTISANQLAEYLLASPAKRQTIIRNAKFPPVAIVTRYKKAKEAIGNFLADDARNKRILYDIEASLKETEQSSKGSWERDDARLSIEVLQHFCSFIGNNALAAIRFSKPNGKSNLSINDVSIKISLNLLAHSSSKSGDRVGGLILQTSKTITSASVREEHGRNVATLIWLLVNEKYNSLGEPDKKICIALDVFGKNMWTTPTSYKRRTNDINAACTEIKMFWDVIPAPVGLQID